MINTGIKFKQSMVVTYNDTAIKHKSGNLEVFSSPAMIAFMENTCAISVEDELEEGFDTVGISVNIKHIAASPINAKIICESNLIEVINNKLIFEVKCFDEHNEIGNGFHERFIINKKKFLNKINKR